MQRIDRPLSFGEIFDRAITLVFTTLRTTIPIAIVLFFIPGLIVQLLRNVAHLHALADFAFDFLMYPFSALAGIATLVVFSSALDGIGPSRSSIITVLRRYGLKTVLLVAASLVPVLFGGILVLLPWEFWHYAQIHQSSTTGVILVVAALPFAAFGIALAETTSLFTRLTQLIMIEEGTRLRTAMTSARRRLVARDLRRRNIATIAVLAGLTFLSYGIEHWSHDAPYISSHFLRLVLGWPFGMYGLGVAAVLNRDARVRLEGFDIEQRLAVLSSEVRATT